MGTTENLTLYEKGREVPEQAQKKITGGRLNGKTDINPMWRIKKLTEMFGPCGIGWMTEITDKRLEPGADGTVAAFVDINLYIKHDNEWSKAIPGTGGSMFVDMETKGLYTSDECFKMAYTDAISVACKALGIGADVYWAEDSTKYTPQSISKPAIAQEQQRAVTSKPQRTSAFPTPPPNNDAVQANGQVQGSCPACGGAISEAERKYSLDKFGRAMCRKCQARNKP